MGFKPFLWIKWKKNAIKLIIFINMSYIVEHEDEICKTNTYSFFDFLSSSLIWRKTIENTNTPNIIENAPV